MLFAWLYNLPFVVEVASDSDQYKSKRFGNVLDFLCCHIGRLCIPKAVGALYVADFLREKWHCENSLVLSNVVINEIKPPKTFSQNQTIKIVTVGALSYRKGIDILIAALKDIDIGKRLELHIAGPIIDKGILEIVESFSSTSVEIIMHGVLPHSSIMTLLDDADIYVQASRSEGLPRSLLEAMSRGLPVIASDLPGIKGVLDGKYKFGIGDYAKLTSLLVGVLSDRYNYEESAIRSSASVECYLSDYTKMARKQFYARCKEMACGRD
ncbi:glycosyltransferase family 4 protein [Amylibacter sp.]|nr:glycosyltransferase family 4 protein [Amylibacter sp.]